MKRLEGKVAIVTGGNSGIGRASVERFAREGAQVAILGRDAESLAATRAALGDQGLVVQGDVTRSEDLARLFEEATRAFGKVDVLFANAGLGLPGELSDIDDASFDTQFGVNVKGMVDTVRQALPHLNEGASVILTSSVIGELPMPGMSVYAATKAATRSFVKSLSLELAPRGVRLNSVAPGPIETGFFARTGLPEDAARAMAEGIRESVPMKRFGTADEVANVVLFLASDEASYVTGAEWVVDGGAQLQPVGG